MIKNKKKLDKIKEYHNKDETNIILFNHYSCDDNNNKYNNDHIAACK